MRITRQVTRRRHTTERVICNQCDKVLRYPCTSCAEGTPEEVNLCAQKDGSGESCETTWNEAQSK